MPTEVKILGKVGSKFFNILLDAITRALTVITYPHSELHDGNKFSCVYQLSRDTAETVNIRVEAPDSAKWGHVVFEVEGTLGTSWTLYEGSTHDEGTKLTIHNRNRNSDNEAGLTGSHTASGGAAGNVLDQGSFGAGKKGGGQARDDEEWMTKQAEVYFLEATSHANGNIVTLRANWYEHTNKPT